MFCCKNSKKNKYSIQAFNKIKPQDKQQFILNAQRGQTHDLDLIKRICSNQRVGECPAPNSKNELQNLIQGSLQDFIKKKILKSDYEDLVRKYSYSDEMWKDPNFLPNDKSFGNSNIKVVWKRVSQIIQNPTFVSDNFTPSDILQGKLGNCYFLSAVAGLAEKPYRIKKIFSNTELNKNGIYMARLLHKGVFQEVVVDDYFPCTPNGQLVGAQPAGGTQIWVMILQKCWAKVFGSYNAIDGGLPSEVLNSFSAAPTYSYRVTNDQQELDKLWQKLVSADQKDQIICCGTQPQTRNGGLSKLGLVGGHAYTILGVYEQSYRMLKIRNPWGNMEWKGSASDNDKKFWSRIAADEQLHLGYNNRDDGTFFMLFQDFQKYFVIVDICQIDDNANYFYIQCSFLAATPQCFDLNTQGGDLTLNLTQPSKRQLKARGQKNINKYAHTVMILARDLGNNQFEYIDSKSEENNCDLYLFAPNLTEGKYVICCFVDGYTTVSELTISIYGQANFYIIQSTVSLQDYLHQCFLNHARNNQTNRQILSQNPLEWVCFDILTENCGIGYSAFHLDPRSPKKLGLQFDQSEYLSNTLELLPPFKGSKKIKLVCKPGEQLIVLCRLKPGNYVTQFTIPTPKMFKLK